MVAGSNESKIWEYSPPGYQHRALIKFRAVRYRSKSNLPLISGDTFRLQADLDVSRLPLNDLEFRLLRDAKVIFCKSDLLKEFISQYRNAIRARVILCGNSDFEFHHNQPELPPSVKACFLQNSFVSDNKNFFTLPIGIENLRIGTNGIPRLFNLDTEWPNKMNRLLIGPFGLTHDDRRNLRELASGNIPSVDFGIERLTPKSLARVNASYKKIAAVRGNGVDTHRLWEIAYLGSIPIVKRDTWSLSLKYLNLPLEYVDDWSRAEITRVASGDYVQPPKPSQLASRGWPYWKARIEAYCR